MDPYEQMRRQSIRHRKLKVFKIKCCIRYTLTGYLLGFLTCLVAVGIYGMM